MTPCDSCDGADLELIATRDRDGEPLETAMCARCGLVRHLHVPAADQLEAYYRDAYRQDYHGEETPSRRRVVRAWRRGQALFVRLRRFVSEGGSVFEVGAGLGLNLKPFQLAGYAAAGIEPHEGFHGFSREVLGVDVGREGLEAIAADPRHDLVILAHVIEHMPSPREALEAILAKLLRPGGAVYVECPNVSAPFARPGKLFHRAHVTNFTPDTLALVAARCGLVVAERFATVRDPTIAVLLRRGDPEPLDLDAVGPRNRERTLRAMRSGWLGYHLRPAYLSLRAVKVAERARELVGTARAYREILRRCETAP